MDIGKAVGIYIPRPNFFGSLKEKLKLRFHRVGGLLRSRGGAETGAIAIAALIILAI